MFLVPVLCYTVVVVARNITAGSKVFCFILGHKTKYNSKRNIHDKNVIFSYGSGAFQPCSWLATMQNYIIENCIVSHLGTSALSIASPFFLYFSLSTSTNYCLMSLPHPLRLIRELYSYTQRTMFQSYLVQLLTVTSLNVVWKLLFIQPKLGCGYSVLARKSLNLARQLSIYLRVLAGHIYCKKEQERLTLRFHKRML